MQRRPARRALPVRRVLSGGRAARPWLVSRAERLCVRYRLANRRRAEPLLLRGDVVARFVSLLAGPALEASLAIFSVSRSEIMFRGMNFPRAHQSTSHYDYANR